MRAILERGEPISKLNTINLKRYFNKIDGPESFRSVVEPFKLKNASQLHR